MAKQKQAIYAVQIQMSHRYSKNAVVHTWLMKEVCVTRTTAPSGISA